MGAQKTPRSPAARWRFRRDLVICLAYRNGASQRLLGDVFDLPPSRIAAILKAFRQEYGGRLPVRILPVHSSAGANLTVEIALPMPDSRVEPTDLEPALPARDRVGRGGSFHRPRSGRTPRETAA